MLARKTKNNNTKTAHLLHTEIKAFVLTMTHSHLYTLRTIFTIE